VSTDDQKLHPNLADAIGDDAIGDDAVGAADLDAIARRLSELTSDDEIQSPPASVFAAIEAELGVNVVPLASRRSRRPPLMAAAAAVVVVVVIVGAALQRDTAPAVRTQEVALAGLPGFAAASGSATVVIDGDDRSVAVALSAVEVPAGSHLEVWLLDDPIEQLVSLGELSDDAPHRVPPSVDLAVTPIVDISLEPDDGNPAHSGVSVVRGSL